MANAKTPAVISPYQRYLAEIEKHPVLTKEEEHRYAVRYYKYKDPRDAHILVTSNLRFVIHIAHEYTTYGIKIMDLIQEGNIGLMRAVKTFNPYKEVRLITYAVWWIRAYIQEYIQRNWSMVKIGTTQAQRKLFYKLNQEKHKLEAMGNAYDVKLLSHRLKVKEKDIREMEGRLAARDISLDEFVGEEESPRRRVEFLADEQAAQAETEIENREQSEYYKKQIEAFKGTLKERECAILELRLLSEQPLTLEELGKKYHITKERVRQLENQLKHDLKDFLTKHE